MEINFSLRAIAKSMSFVDVNMGVRKRGKTGIWTPGNWD